MNNIVGSILDKFIASNSGSITPTQQSYIDTLKSGDASRGEQLAMNLCNTMGVSKDEAIAQARQFFHI